MKPAVREAKLIMEPGYQNAKTETAVANRAKSTNQINNKTGWNQLHEAVIYGQTKKVQDLLNQGFDTSLLSKEGKTALHYASESVNAKLIKMLLSAGSDPSIKTPDGKTALHLVCEKDNIDSLKLLCESGINAINLQDKAGRTALHYAALHENYEIFKNLLEHYGADPNVFDNARKKPYQLARGKIFYDIVRSKLGSPRASPLILPKPKNTNQEKNKSEQPEKPAIKKHRSKEVLQVLGDITNKIDARSQLKHRPDQFETISTSFQRQISDVSNIISKRFTTESCETLRLSTHRDSKLPVQHSKDSLNCSNVENLSPKFMAKTERHNVVSINNLVPVTSVNLAMAKKPSTKLKLSFAKNRSSLNQQETMFSFRDSESNQPLDTLRSDKSFIAEREVPKPHSLPSRSLPKTKPVTPKQSAAHFKKPTFQSQNRSLFETSQPFARESIEKCLVSATLQDFSTNTSSTRPSIIAYDSGPQTMAATTYHKHGRVETVPFEFTSRESGTVQSVSNYHSIESGREKVLEEKKLVRQVSGANSLAQIYEQWKANQNTQKAATVSTLNRSLPDNRLQESGKIKRRVIKLTRKEPVFEGQEKSTSFGCCTRGMFDCGFEINGSWSARTDTLPTTRREEPRLTEQDSITIIAAQPHDLAYLTIENWLKAIGLRTLVPNFKDNNYSFLKEFKDDFAGRPSTDLIYKLGIDKAGHRAWLIFKLKEDFGEIERKGLFAYAHSHPSQCGKYPTIENWLSSLGLSSLIPNFTDAGYVTLEPLLMQIELDEMRVDDDFLENELGISKREARKTLLAELARVYEMGCRMNSNEAKQLTLQEFFIRQTNKQSLGLLKKLMQ